ncbi:putative oxidoreductase [Streptomyces sp. NBRC 110611]|uniref:FAD-dependent oxidoreductase n=1 Tax=Streptomyces sp. NBRC 110611 TaxID=1621259 RepID=UPI00082ABF43|nr:FAD-dependent oxidoreductase [Streptomyces sp. NBRC 110611]GAU67098.1 putative oxidoreductase [Streptomyces sp. NBRC 110611]
MSHVLVLGNGPTAHQFAERLRHHGHEGTVTVMGTEPGPAHHRPSPLSVIEALRAPKDLRLPPPPGIGVRTDAVVTGIDRERREVRAVAGGAGTAVPYDTLVLAMEALPTVPGVPGVTAPDGSLAAGVTTLRTAADCDRITGGTVVVLGDGPQAVETASALAARGTTTTLVCGGPTPLHDRLGDLCGGMLTEELERSGVTVLGGRTAVRRTPGQLRLDDGTTLRAGTLVLCAGATPDVRLARKAGLDIGTGVVVDARLRTGDPHIHAIGDCAEHEGRAMAGTDAALEQADALARILTGRGTAHRAVPPSLRLRTQAADVSCIGSPADFARPGTRLVTLTDRAGRRYARLALRHDRVVGAVLFGLPRATATIGRLHRLRQQLPTDRLGLLLGWPPRPASDEAEADGDALVCLCNSVTERALHQAWRAGSRTVAALAATTRATTGCGGCGERVRELCGAWARGSRNELREAS